MRAAGAKAPRRVKRFLSDAGIAGPERVVGCDGDGDPAAHGGAEHLAAQTDEIEGDEGGEPAPAHVLEEETRPHRPRLGVPPDDLVALDLPGEVRLDLLARDRRGEEDAGHARPPVEVGDGEERLGAEGIVVGQPGAAAVAEPEAARPAVARSIRGEPVSTPRASTRIGLLTLLLRHTPWFAASTVVRRSTSPASVTI